MTSKSHRNVEALSRLLQKITWGLTLILVVMGIFGKRGWLDLRRMKKENQRLVSEMNQLQEQNEHLHRQIHAIQFNPQIQEVMIRKVLGYIKRDEKIIEF